jgi:hypothetical protein
MSRLTPPEGHHRAPAAPAPAAAGGPAPGLVARHIDKQQAHQAERDQPALQVLRDDQREEEHEVVQTRIAVYLRDVKVSRRALRPDGTSLPRKGGGQRGAVSRLSRNSLRRFRFTLHNVRGLDFALHLTYPQRFPNDGAAVKRHWKAMREWLVRQGIGGIWALEFQACGGPHFMLLLIGRLEKEAVAARWAAIVGSGTAAHGRAGTRIERVRNPHAIRNYLLKSVDHPQKQVPACYESVGRLWGCFGGVRAEPVQLLEGSRADLAPVVRSLRNLETAERRRRAREGRGGRRGAIPLRDNGVGGWTAHGLAPAAGRCLERLAPQLLNQALAQARPGRSSRKGGAKRNGGGPASLGRIRPPRPADWELLEPWLLEQGRRLERALAGRRPARSPQRGRAHAAIRLPGLLADRPRCAVNRLTARTGAGAGWLPRAGRPPPAPGVRAPRQANRGPFRHPAGACQWRY